MILISITVSILTSLFILPGIIKFLKCNKNEVKNYKGKTLYNSAGIFFAINILVLCIFLICYNTLFLNNANNSIVIAIIIGTLGSSFTGYIDDNSKDLPKGIKNHVYSLLKGNITAGSIKAFIGIITSFIICFILDYKGLNFLINMLIISFMQNFINLLDLRPGRSIKAFIIILLIDIPFIIQNPALLAINAGITISLLFYIKYELSEVCMMGDTGSNLLGIMLGISTSMTGNIYYRIITLSFLFISLVYAEKKSISDLINKKFILRYLDDLGRQDIYDKNKKRRSH